MDTKQNIKNKKKVAIIDREEAENLCFASGVDIDSIYNDFSKAIVSFNKDNLEQDIKFYVQEHNEKLKYEQIEKKRKEYLKNRSFIDKILKDDYEEISINKIAIILILIAVLSVIGYFTIRDNIGKSCISGEEPSVFRLKCINKVCNGGVTYEGIFRENALYFIDTFIYEYQNGGCISKCYDLNESYHNSYSESIYPYSHLKEDYYFWKDGKCHLLPRYKYVLSEEIIFRRNIENDLRERENKEVIQKRNNEEKELKKYFFEKLENNRSIYDVGDVKLTYHLNDS